MLFCLVDFIVGGCNGIFSKIVCVQNGFDLGNKIIQRARQNKTKQNETKQNKTS